MEIREEKLQEHGLENLRCLRRIETQFVEDGSFEYFGDKLDTPEKIASCLRRIGRKDREVGVVLFLNSEFEPIGYDLWLGSIDFVTVDPRRVFAVAALVGASKIAIAHNHPSGNNKPSGGDEAFCLQMAQLCSLMGMHFVDFQVITQDGFYSFRLEKHPAIDFDVRQMLIL